jgi:YesN/AraC family two-component response regulator
MSFPHILLVDDDQRFRREMIEYLKDYNIIQASSGEDALRLLAQPNEIDLVILDVMMPGLDGIHVLKRMKQMSPDLGIIILTGFSSKDIAIKALKEHADDYVEKPLQVRQIRNSIERLLKDKRGILKKGDSGIEDKVERIKYYLERNYDKKLNLSIVAKLVCLSPKYVSKIFKDHTGIGFNEYRLKIKAEMAKELLDKSGYNINELARKLGYDNTESFIISFKKFTGLTPAKYRKKRKGSSKTSTQNSISFTL